MKLLVIDNYDSFTYNLVQIIEEFSVNIIFETTFNDTIGLEKIKNFDKILLSPGAGIPLEAGIMLETIKHYAAQKSILGVCLGHQAIAESFGATLENLPFVQHGRIKKVNILKEDNIFTNIPQNFEAGLYHSWAVSPQNFPNTLEITAESDGMIMAIAHKTFDIKGIQFHPESVMTPQGKQILNNWLNS